ncbi:HEPN domain-containing protein [Kyrpidia tusciae]|uniref:HEPN domain-containing protein n=1 Tax=Kyrpidia tusciae TaxID=33943 RepID=UPI00145F904E|nr:HEPN domain-containing protein [Kyrpidia tusciae]
MDKPIRCRVCRKPLRSKESIDRGVGPTCAKHIPYKDISQIARKDVRYWIQEAYEDISTAYFLKRAGKRKLESAFFAHLAVEKAIKSLVAQNTHEVPPKIHNLVELAKRAGLHTTQDQREFLLMLNVYEIEGRYPAERAKILARTPDSRFEEILEKASGFIQWCTQRIK